MNCNCEKAPEFPTKAFIPGPIEIPINFRAVTIPADQGDDVANPPQNGAYRNVVLKYAANGHTYIYSSDGIPVMLVGSITFDSLPDRPKYDGQPMTSYTDIPNVTGDIEDIEGDIEDINGDISDINDKIAALATDFSYKGSVEDYAHLPSDAATGDVYTTTDTGVIYVWDGNAWVALNEYPSVFVGTDGTSAGEEGLVPAPTAADAGKVLGANGTWVQGGPTVVQTTGTSTSSVMSQDATTNMLWRDPSTKKTLQYVTWKESNSRGNDLNNIYIGADMIARDNSGGNVMIGHKVRSSGPFGKTVMIGDNISTLGSDLVSIGYEDSSLGHQKSDSSVSIGNFIGNVPGASVLIGSGRTGVGEANPPTAASGSSVVIGNNASAASSGGVAIGRFAGSTRRGEFSIGLQNTADTYHTNAWGYNRSNFRLLSGVYTPGDDYDAANKAYVDANTPTNFTTNEWNALWA